MELFKVCISCLQEYVLKAALPESVQVIYDLIEN